MARTTTLVLACSVVVCGGRVFAQISSPGEDVEKRAKPKPAAAEKPTYDVLSRQLEENTKVMNVVKGLIKKPGSEVEITKPEGLAPGLYLLKPDKDKSTYLLFQEPGERKFPQGQWPGYLKPGNADSERDNLIKEQQQLISDQQAEIDRLQGENSDLRKRIKTLESQTANLKKSLDECRAKKK